MKKVVFTILFFCALYLKGFSFVNDTLSKKEKLIIIKTNLTLLLSPELNLMCEYKVKNFGIESGLAYNMSYIGGSGFTVRAGTKFYFHKTHPHNNFVSQMYLEPLFFYRYMDYKSTIYWIDNDP